MLNYLYDIATDKSKGVMPSVIGFFLFILSFVYGFIVRLLILFRRLLAYQPGCKVISVGNITLGGTGKTVLVEYIARFLKEEGRKPAIISRGYRRKTQAGTARENNFENMGDEPYMLSQKLSGIPVIVDANRPRGIRLAIREHAADTVILDDGLQQWQIKKGLEIVTLDSANPFGNRKLLPRGILRQPLSTLKGADIFILTKTNLVKESEGLRQELARLNPSAQIFEADYQAEGFLNIARPDVLGNVSAFKGKSAVLFCGIADPDSFERLASSLGIKVAFFFRFPDHHDYTQEDLNNIIAKAKENNTETIITTEKDAVRLESCQLSAFSYQLYVLKIRLALKDEQRFRDRLRKLYTL